MTYLFSTLIKEKCPSIKDKKDVSIKIGNDDEIAVPWATLEQDHQYDQEGLPQRLYKALLDGTNVSVVEKGGGIFKRDTWQQITWNDLVDIVEQNPDIYFANITEQPTEFASIKMLEDEKAVQKLDDDGKLWKLAASVRSLQKSSRKRQESAIEQLKQIADGLKIQRESVERAKEKHDADQKTWQDLTTAKQGNVDEAALKAASEAYDTSIQGLNTAQASLQQIETHWEEGHQKMQQELEKSRIQFSLVDKFNPQVVEEYAKQHIEEQWKEPNLENLQKVGAYLNGLAQAGVNPEWKPKYTEKLSLLVEIAQLASLELNVASTKLIALSSQILEKVSDPEMQQCLSTLPPKVLLPWVKGVTEGITQLDLANTKSCLDAIKNQLGEEGKQLAEKVELLETIQQNKMTPENWQKAIQLLDQDVATYLKTHQNNIYPERGQSLVR